MTILSGGGSITSVVAAGAQASIVMGSSGGKSVEVWPVGSYPPSLDTQFVVADDVAWLPISTFDYRTAAGSNRSPSTVTTNAYKARLTTAATYQARLDNQPYDGNHLVMEVITVSPMTTLSFPSSLVLSSDKDGWMKVEVAYGSGGVIFKVMTGATVLYEKLVLVAIPNAATIKLERIKQNIKVYSNGVLIASDSSQYFESATGNQYPGVGTYADATNISTAISRVTISGSSSVLFDRSVQEHLVRAPVVVSTLSETCRAVVKTGGLMKVSLTNVSWEAPTTLSDRSHTVRLNGTNIGAISTQTGDSVVINNVNVPNGGVLTVHSYSNSSVLVNRTIKSGYLSAVLM